MVCSRGPGSRKMKDNEDYSKAPGVVRGQLLAPFASPNCRARWVPRPLHRTSMNNRPAGWLTRLPKQIPALRPRQYATISKPQKTVQRAYGGSRCSNCVRQRIIRAFLIEEQKIVKKVLKEQTEGGKKK